MELLEGEKGLRLATGGADAKIHFWRDRTAEAEKEQQASEAARASQAGPRICGYSPGFVSGD